MGRMLQMLTGILVAASPTFAFADARLTSGTLYVASSWNGTPAAGYSNVSNSDTVVHGPTFGSIAYASLPLSLAYTYAYDYNGGGYRMMAHHGIGWNANGEPEGPRDFTYLGTVDEIITLSTDSDWSRFQLVDNPFMPFSYARLEDLSHGGAPIDLLQTTSGTLQAGTYRLLTEASGAWTTSGLNFDYTSYVDIDFFVVPAPAGAAMLCFGALLGARRRRSGVLG